MRLNNLLKDQLFIFCIIRKNHVESVNRPLTWVSLKIIYTMTYLIACKVWTKYTKYM